MSVDEAGKQKFPMAINHISHMICFFQISALPNSDYSVAINCHCTILDYSSGMVHRDYQSVPDEHHELDYTP